MASLHILVVEDDVSTNRVLAELLERRGHVVTRAMTVEAALNAAQAKSFDLAFIDIGLPDGDGWDLLARLKKLDDDLESVAISGFGFEEDVKRSFEAGFSNHLTKPIQVATLEREIARVCSCKQTRH